MIGTALRTIILLFVTLAVVQTATATRVLLAPPQSHQLTAWQQCGGQNNCRDGSDCGDKAWTKAQCPKGYSCSRFDSYYWQCRPGAQTATTSMQKPPQAAVKAWDQCGGSSCSSGSCTDAVWASCPQGYVCVRKDQWYYQCRPDSWAQLKDSKSAGAAPTKAANQQTSGNAMSSSATQYGFQSTDTPAGSRAQRGSQQQQQPRRSSASSSPPAKQPSPQQQVASYDVDSIVVEEVPESMLVFMEADTDDGQQQQQQQPPPLQQATAPTPAPAPAPSLFNLFNFFG